MCRRLKSLFQRFRFLDKDAEKNYLALPKFQSAAYQKISCQDKAKP